MQTTRWAVVIAALLLLGTIAALAYAAGKAKAVPVAEVIRAKRIQLVDSTGRARIDLLMFSPTTPQLVMTDPRGEVGVMLGMSKEGSFTLTLKDTSSRCTVVTAASANGPSVFGMKGREIVWGLPAGVEMKLE